MGLSPCLKFVIGGTLTILSWDNPVTAYFRKSRKLRHSLGRPSRSDFVQFQVGEAVCPTIITNKHVVNYNQYENVKFHLHLKEENGESNKSVGVQVNANWYFHSTKDLCFTFVNPVFEDVKRIYGKNVFYVANDASIMATKEKLKELSALEELVMVGYPIGLSDTRNNYPIFRKGYTSAHPAVDFNDDGIGLVDMACFPGSSGSPIYILNEGGYRDKRGNSYFGKSRVLLLGILYAGPQYDARGEIVVKTIPTSKHIVELNTSITTNLGYYIIGNWGQVQGS